MASVDLIRLHPEVELNDHHIFTMLAMYRLCGCDGKLPNRV